MYHTDVEPKKSKVARISLKPTTKVSGAKAASSVKSTTSASVISGSNQREAFAEGFTTGFDDDKNAAAKRPASTPSTPMRKKKPTAARKDHNVPATPVKKKNGGAKAKTANKILAPKKPTAKGKGGKGEEKGKRRTTASPSNYDKSEKGKVVDVGKMDSDDDSLGLDEEGMVEPVQDIRKSSKAKKPLTISVSYGFVNVSTAERVYLISFPRLGNVFYLKAEHFKSLLKVALKKRKLVNPSEDGDWMETVTYYRMRATEYGDESKWRRTEVKGNTIDLMHFIFTVPLNDEESFACELANKIKYFFDITRKRKTDVMKRLASKHVRNLSKGSNGALGLFCLNKAGGDPAKTAKIMMEEIDNFWKHEYTLQYHTHLNKTMVDGDIKEFLINHVGATSWDDLDEASKSACFKDYPKKSLPEWNEIVQESF